MTQALTQYVQSKVHLRAKVMDVASTLTGCAGQAADAISAYTQVKMEDAPSWLKISKSECPDIWIRLPNSKWPKSWSSMEDPVVLLEGKFEKVLLEHGWEQVPNWECFFVHREKCTILVCVWSKTGWKDTKHWPNVESTCERSRFGRTDIILWPCLFGLHSARMSNEQRYCGQLQKYVWIKLAARGTEKQP